MAFATGKDGAKSARPLEKGQLAGTFSTGASHLTNRSSVLFDRNQSGQPVRLLNSAHRRAEARLAKHGSEPSTGADLPK
jgi:hypothetical protein